MTSTPIKFSIILAGLSLTSSVLYLAGYWGAFNINVFEFLSFDDLVRSAIYPLLGIASLFVFHGLMYGPMLTPRMFAEGSGTVLTGVEPTKREREDDQERRRQAVRKFKVVGGVAGLAWLGYVAISGSYGQVVYALAIAASIAMGLHLKNSEYAEDSVREPILRGLICIVFVLIPTVSLVHGVVRAHRLIFSAGDFLYVCESDLKESDVAKSTKELRFIGKADEYFFFVQDPEITEIKVLQYNDFRRMVFRHSIETLRGEISLLFWKRKQKVDLCLPAARPIAGQAGR
ncbi:membrane hypothetical protein [Rubrivivax sp. A210]|uniref:hypothetical protein n=1 Tax=Rubrivivax sp. A210 TaxID=2772301 RepID=UPI00191A54AA|nr:hypothetical protein [Rubrivivax sp. A210]CAD5374030.1 membrane hypothetical protein [Rubrivivax sp. A210]